MSKISRPSEYQLMSIEPAQIQAAELQVSQELVQLLDHVISEDDSVSISYICQLLALLTTQGISEPVKLEIWLIVGRR
jgi:hypothetical protein